MNGIALKGALPIAAQTLGGYVVYPGAFGVGGTVLHRALPAGSEDFLYLLARQATPEVDYSVALGTGVAGLRLVGGTLEMLDATGAPRLHVSPPYIVGSDGTRTDGALAVTDCSVDSDPSAPWGRAVTTPGATTCTVSVTWPDASVVYPAILDPRWTTTGSMGTARFEHTLLLLSTGRALAAGGRSSTSSTTGLTSAELYDPATGTWSATGTMAHARRLHSMTQLGSSSNGTTSGKVLVAGGISGTTSTNTAELYSPTAGTWIAAGNLDTPRHAHTATLLADGRVLAAGGLNGTTMLTTAALYNPASGAGSWVATTGPVPPTGVKNQTATLIQTTNTQLNNHVLLVGGNNGTSTISAVYLFDPVQNAFSTLASIPSPREQHTAVTLTNSNGKILVAGGKNGVSVLASAIVFDPSFSNGTWSSAGTMNSPRVGHTMTQLPNSIVANGQLLVAGGSSTGSDTLQSAELFSGTSTWTVTPSMPGPLQGHQAVLLSGNMVLAAGGLSSTTTVQNAAYLYDASFGLSCTSNSQCASGFCVSGVCCNTACSGNSCTACNLAGSLGTCSVVANGTTCNDGNACTQTDTCQSGTCTGSNPVTCTAQDQCHVAGTCNTSTGVCSNPTAANGTTCSDGNACTQTDTCQSGTCTGSNPVTCTAEDQCHSAGTCTPSTGACSNPVLANGTACNDGNACTQTDSCQSGTCTGSNPVTCTAEDQCHTAGTCSPSTGVCSNPNKTNGTACNDGNACTTADSCQSGTCAGTSVTCTALDQCHTAGTCNPSTGTCSNPNKTNGTACNDGNACTTADACQSGSCSGTAVTCTAQDQCHSPGTCNQSTGACSNPAVANGTTCNDGNACTQTDTCQTGTCTGSNPITCTAQDQCHVAGTCSPSTGACTNPTVANGTTCNDGNACTTADACQSGACTGTAVTCTAQDQCHSAGTCNPSTGACSNPTVANGTACNDGNACTQTDTCQSGACSGGNPITCAAEDQCHTAGTCNPSTGACTNPTVANGTTCNDGNACTQTDSCQSGTCTGGNPVSCTAQDQCHTPGTCNPSNGSCSNPSIADGTTCNDANACTTGDACHSGTCSGTAVTCVAQDQCHAVGTCDPSSGTCSNPTVANGAMCSDGNACTTGDACQAGSCVSGPSTCAAISIVRGTDGSLSVPILNTTLTPSPLAVVPGDLLTFTSAVTNTSLQFQDRGFTAITNQGTAAFTIGSYQQTLEYFSLATQAWVVFAKVSFDATGAEVDDPNLPVISASGLFGVTIAPGATAEPDYTISATLLPDVVNLVADPLQANGIRDVLHIDTGSGTPGASDDVDITDSFANDAASITDATETLVMFGGGGSSADVPLIASSSLIS